MFKIEVESIFRQDDYMYQHLILDHAIFICLEELKALPNDAEYAQFEPVLKKGVNLLMNLYAKEDRAL